MTAALLWTLGALIFAAEIAAIVFWIAQDGGAEMERDARLAEPLNLPPAREDLAGDAVEVIHIGRRDNNPAPDCTFVERLARELEPAGSPWGRPIGAELAIAAAQRAEAGTGWGGYRPRHARPSGPITQAFEAITAQFATDEPTTEIGVRAA